MMNRQRIAQKLELARLGLKDPKPTTEVKVKPSYVWPDHYYQHYVDDRETYETLPECLGGKMVKK